MKINKQITKEINNNNNNNKNNNNNNNNNNGTSYIALQRGYSERQGRFAIYMSLRI